ncbi:MAG TPA: L-ribulose-5-phosphate 4-epimerase AraD [Chloroflexota bacterium]|nr:L-ribulose-5-phosphate 4-epimerase AraD [Chloroflexota bacterium]
MSSHFDLRERVLEANLGIVRAGLVVLTFGNASGVDRSAGVMAIKPSGVDYDALTPESMVLIDIQSGRVVDGPYRPSSDTATHLVLYRHFAAIGGIVHTHSTFATSWAQARRAIPCFGTTHADHFHGPVPVTRPLSADEIQRDYEQRTGEVIAETFGRLGLDPLAMPAVLVASHGPFAWGQDTAQAAENAIALEAVATMAAHTLLLDPNSTAIARDLLDRHFQRKHGTNAYYGQMK